MAAIAFDDTPPGVYLNSNHGEDMENTLQGSRIVAAFDRALLEEQAWPKREAVLRIIGKYLDGVRVVRVTGIKKTTGETRTFRFQARGSAPDNVAVPGGRPRFISVFEIPDDGGEEQWRMVWLDGVQQIAIEPDGPLFNFEDDAWFCIAFYPGRGGDDRWVSEMRKALVERGRWGIAFDVDPEDNALIVRYQFGPPSADPTTRDETPDAAETRPAQTDTRRAMFG